MPKATPLRAAVEAYSVHSYPPTWHVGETPICEANFNTVALVAVRHSQVRRTQHYIACCCSLIVQRSPAHRRPSSDEITLGRRSQEYYWRFSLFLPLGRKALLFSPVNNTWMFVKRGGSYKTCFKQVCKARKFDTRRDHTQQLKTPQQIRKT